jgi:serine/threonine-protein kinase
MSPEQSAGDQLVDSRSDVYALATVAYEALAGEPPFTGPTAQAIFARRFRESPRPIQDTREMLPPAVDAVIARGLARIPADRFQSAGAFAAALAEAARGGQTPAVAAAVPRPKSLWRWLGPVVAVAVVVLGLWFWRGRQPASGAVPARPSRLAVLPLAGIGPGEEDYFADGMTDELIGALSRVPGLQVIARTSVMDLKGKFADAGEVGRTLGVDHLVEGTVRHDGTRARINLRLVEVATQATVWDSTFDTGVADVFATQAEVARRVAEILRVKLGAGEESAQGPRVAVNPEAYDLVLRGRYQLAAGNDSRRLDSAAALFTRATEVDPGYAVAYAELADALSGKLFYQGPNSALQERAWLALQRAIALDSTLELAWSTRAALDFTRESGWQIKEAIRDLRHALRLNPSSARTHGRLGAVYDHAGLTEEALAEFRTAVSLDPADAFARPRIGRTLWYAGRYEEAVGEFGKMDRETWAKAVVLQHLGRHGEALDVLRRLAPDSSAWSLDIDVNSTHALVLASQGRRVEALKFASLATAQVPKTHSHLHHAAYNIASTWALLGEADSALAWLRQTASDGMPNYTLFVGDPNLRGLKANPAFEQFIVEQRRLHEEFRAVARE